jgi:uncharacterized protein
MPADVARRVMVFLTEDDTHGHHSVAEELLRRAQESGMAGATIWRGVEGFGARGHLRAARLPDLARGLPLVVEVIDDEPKIEQFLALVDELAEGALVTSEQVEITRTPIATS